MTAPEPFRNPNPLVFGESVKRRALFDEIASDIKNRYAEQGKFITDQEAVEAANNLIKYVELAAETADRLRREAEAAEREKESSA
jgi:hypothetical protein